MRIAAGAIAALIIIIGLLWWRLDSVTERAIEAEGTVKTQDEAIKTLSTAAYNYERAAIKARKRDEQSALEAANANKLLESLKNENKDLREYLASRIPSGIACWMQRNSSNEGNTTTGESSGADPKACLSIQPTHQEGWSWCRDMETAFDKCEGDKRLIAEFYKGFEGDE